MSGRKRSVIWNHFDVIYENTARCKYCGKCSSTKHGSIGNLHRHIKKKHKSISIHRSAKIRRPGTFDPLLTEERSFSSSITDSYKVDGKHQAGLLMGSLKKKVSPLESTTKPQMEFVNVTFSPDRMTEIVDLMENEDALGILSDDKINLKIANDKMNPRYKKRSKVWFHFKQLSEGKVKCCYCSRVLSFVGGATGNLNRHMKLKHSTDVLASDNEEELNASAAEYMRSNSLTSENADVKPNAIKMNQNMTMRKSSSVKVQSNIWNHFIKISKNEAKCMYCGQFMIISHSSTGNLFRHINMKHTEIEIDAEMSSSDQAPEPPDKGEIDYIPEADTTNNQNSLIEKSNLAKFIKLNAYPKKKTNKPNVSILNFNQYDQQLIKVIVKEFYPFSIVDGVEFKKFIHMLCPTYNLPSRKVISTSLIPHLYEVTLDKVREKVSQACTVCLAMEGWTSISNEYYLSITAHFIDNDTELCSYMLGCISFNELDTPEYIASLLKRKVEEWGLEHRVEAVVTENVENITAAICHAGWTHIHCFAHTINLIVHAGLKEINVVIEKVRDIVDTVKRSNNGLAQLESIQEQLGLPKIKLKQAIGTRWNSIYDMLSRIITIKDAVILMPDMLQSECVLSDHEWEVIKKTVEILEIFNVMTNEIRSEKVLSVSKLILYSRAMDKFVKKYTNTTTLLPGIRMMVEALQNQLVTHFKDIENNKLSLEATLLDPRFKRKAFIDDNHFAVAYSSLSQQVGNIILETPLQEENPDESHSSLVTLWEDFDYEVTKDKSVEDSTRLAILELDKYLQEPLFDRRENPLTWWREWKRLYPRCYEVMKRRLCITATSVPCERLFAKEGQNIIDKRSRIYSSKISEILFLNHNLE